MNTWLTDRIWGLLGARVSIQIETIAPLSSFKNEIEYRDITDISKKTSTTLLELYGINVPHKPPVNITKLPVRKGDIIYALISEGNSEYLSLKRIEVLSVAR